MVRRITEIFLIFIIQIFCLVLTYETLNYYYPLQHKEVGFGITVFYFVIIFTSLFFVYNFYVEFFTKRIYLIAVVLLFTINILPLLTINFRPFRSILLIILSILGFVSTLIINKWRKKNKLNIEKENKPNKAIENEIESKSDFHKKIELYFNNLSDNRIPKNLIEELINQITDIEYNNYNRFWNQYPKSRKRYSKLKIEDLEHPFINYMISDYFKQNASENYEKYSLILLKMTTEEFREYEINKYQYETK